MKPTAVLRNKRMKLGLVGYQREGTKINHKETVTIRGPYHKVAESKFRSHRSFSKKLEPKLPREDVTMEKDRA